MKVDAIIAAGDGRAARKVFRKNKALLDVGGKPILRHIVETLKACERIGKIVVVGPKEPFTEILSNLDVEIIEQKRNLTENGWEGFLHTLPEYRETGKLTDEIISKYKEKYVLILSGDIPLLTVKELDEFISQCDMKNYDYILGATSEETLKLFGPRKGRPGIKMATFHSRDGNFRQNNLHMARPFLVINKIDLVLKVYEYRYQKELINIIRATLEIRKIAKGFVLRTLLFYALFQISSGLSMIGLNPIARITSFPITRKNLDALVSNLLNVRVKTVPTTYGGAALDIDNEKDFLTFSVMYKDWLSLINQKK